MTGATRTQLEAAAARFHYNRGFSDALDQVSYNQVWIESVVIASAIVISTLLLCWVMSRGRMK